MKSKLARGFTLIELMIVVAIIGLLAMVAVPKFMTMLAKAKASEAKTNLGTMANLAKAWYGEKGYFDNPDDDEDSCALRHCGWAIDGQSLYNYYFTDDTEIEATKPGAKGHATENVTEVMNADGSFLFGAGGDIDGETTIWDEWSIDHNKDLKNVLNDAELDELP